MLRRQATMHLSLRWLVLPALVVGCAGLLIPASAQESLDAPRVIDGGKFFSKEVVEKADAKIAAIKRNYKKDLLIETFSEVPEKLRKDKDDPDFVRKWAKQQYEKH